MRNLLGAALLFIASLALPLTQLNAQALTNDVHVGPTSLSATGTVAISTQGLGTVTVQATGTGSGLTFVIQGTSDGGTTWQTVQGFVPSTGAAAATFSANGIWAVPVAGFSSIRANLTAIGGGTETFTLEGSVANCSFCGGTSTTLGPGSAIIGKVGIDQTTPGTTNGVVVNSGSVTATSSGATTNPPSTLTLPSTTTAYSANQLIANSATAGSVVVPFFTIANAAGSATIPRLRLTTNDATSTAWGGVSINVDLWSAAPTFTNGDRGTWLPATGTANHLATFSCTMSAEYGDGAYAECAPLVGTVAMPKLASGTSIFWTLDAATASGTTGASKVFTLTAELLN